MEQQHLANGATSSTQSNVAVRSSGVWRTINLRQLQLFEIELQQKQILPQTKGSNRSVAQHAAQEISHWRWCAKRMGIDAGLEFAIDLKAYLLTRRNALTAKLNAANASEAADISLLAEHVTRWNDDADNSMSDAHAIDYLEQFLKALELPEVKILFKKAIRNSLMLRISSAQKSSGKNTIKLLLPFTRDEFCQMVKLRARI